MDYSQLELETRNGRMNLSAMVARRLGWTNVYPRNTWHGFEVVGTLPNSTDWDVVPNYAESLDIAIKLKHEGAHLDLIIQGYDDGAAIAAFIEDGGYRRISIKSMSPACAVCIAWLMYFGEGDGVNVE